MFIAPAHLPSTGPGGVVGAGEGGGEVHEVGVVPGEGHQASPTGTSESPRGVEESERGNKH